MTTRPEQHIAIQCETCRKNLKAPAKLAGKRVKCPCGASIDVPVIDSASSFDESFVAAETAPATTEKQNPNLIQCPDCNAQVSKRAASCPKCGSPLTTRPLSNIDDLNFPSPATLAQYPVPSLSQPACALSVQPIGDGKFLCNGSYETLFAAAERALTMSNVKIKQASNATGEIKGNSRYGINAFGMNVYVRLFATGQQTTVEFAASFSDAFDTLGACKKKVKQISENFAQVMHTSGSSTTAIGVPAIPQARFGAPVASAQSGQSYKGKAVTGFWLSLAGLFFGPCAIVGVIMSGQAYSNINSSNNQEGRSWALAGSIVGFVALLLWAFVVLGIMAS